MTGRIRRHLSELTAGARRVVALVRTEDTLLYAAALAFYGLISVAPLVVVALWVTSLLVGQAQVHDVADRLAEAAPPDVGIDRALERVGDVSTTLGVVAVLVALWPATAYGTALARVLDRVAGDRASPGLRKRGVALVFVALVPVLVLGTLVASYAGAVVLGDTGVAAAIGIVLALAAGFTTAVATVMVVYQVFPRTPPEWRATMHGALATATTISVVSAGYVAYLRFGADFERRYTSDALTAVILLGLWLFAANTALVVGYRIARRHHLPHGDANG